MSKATLFILFTAFFNQSPAFAQGGGTSGGGGRSLAGCIRDTMAFEHIQSVEPYQVAVLAVSCGFDTRLSRCYLEKIIYEGHDAESAAQDGCPDR